MAATKEEEETMAALMKVMDILETLQTDQRERLISTVAVFYDIADVCARDG